MHTCILEGRTIVFMYNVHVGNIHVFTTVNTTGLSIILIVVASNNDTHLLTGSMLYV